MQCEDLHSFRHWKTVLIKILQRTEKSLEKFLVLWLFQMPPLEIFHYSEFLNLTLGVFVNADSIHLEPEFG